MGNHFFVLTSIDGSKPHKPVGCSVMDIPTAYAFFGSDPSKTCARVTAAVNGLVQRWNEVEALKPSVSLTPPSAPSQCRTPAKAGPKNSISFFSFFSGKAKIIFLTTRYCRLIRSTDQNPTSTTTGSRSSSEPSAKFSLRSSPLSLSSTFPTGDLFEI